MGDHLGTTSVVLCGDQPWCNGVAYGEVVAESRHRPYGSGGAGLRQAFSRSRRTIASPGSVTTEAWLREVQPLEEELAALVLLEAQRLQANMTGAINRMLAMVYD